MLEIIDRLNAMRAQLYQDTSSLPMQPSCVAITFSTALWREPLGGLSPFGLKPQQALTLLETSALVRLQTIKQTPEYIGLASTLFEISAFQEPLSPHEATASLPTGAPFWGWRLMTRAHHMGAAAHLEMRLGVGFLALNPRRSPWQIKLLVEGSPTLTHKRWLMGAEPVMRRAGLYLSEATLNAQAELRLRGVVSALGEVSLRLKQTGQLALRVSYHSLSPLSWRPSAPSPALSSIREGLLRLELPLSLNESKRALVDLRYLCLERCALTLEGGFAW